MALCSLGNKKYNGAAGTAGPSSRAQKLLALAPAARSLNLGLNLWERPTSCNIGMAKYSRAGGVRIRNCQFDNRVAATQNWLGFARSLFDCKSVSAARLVCCLFVALLAFVGCGAKGDPKPPQRFAPAACAVRAIDTRTIEVILPKTDVQGNGIAGVEAVKIYYLSLGAKFPTPMEVFTRGEPILERRRQDLPPPGNAVRLSLSHFGRPAGWLVAVPFRAGNIPGEPSAVLAWLDPSFENLVLGTGK